MPESIKPTVVGAAPEGATDPNAAARAVREMFTSIAPHYDLLNHVLSFNVDRMWWRRAARTFRHILSRADARVLDLCCGTGDMTFALRSEAGNNSPQLVGADFSHAMLQRATAKSAAARCSEKSAAPGWIEADALNLPFPEAHFDLVTSAFGFRNLADYDAGLREIVRVLRPGGECGILDFSEPKGCDGRGLPHVLQTSAAASWHDDLRSAWAVCLSARLGGALSRAGRNAGSYEARRIWRGLVDSVHVRHRRLVSRERSKARLALSRIAQQFAQSLNVVGVDVSHHEIAQAALRPIFYVE